MVYVGGNCPLISSIIASSVTVVPTTELPTKSSDLYLTVGVPVVVCVMVIISTVTTLLIACFARRSAKSKKQGLLNMLPNVILVPHFHCFFLVSDVGDIKPEDNPCYSTIIKVHPEDNPCYSTISKTHPEDNPYYSAVRSFKFSMKKNAAYEVTQPVKAF